MPLHRHRARRSTRPGLTRLGFTVIELLLVLTIVGITTAMVAPKLSIATSNADVRSARSALGVRVAGARGTAIRRGQLVRIYFKTNRTWTVADPNPGGARQMVGDSVYLDSLFHVKVEDNASATAVDSIDFDARGLGVGGGQQIRLRITGKSGRTDGFCVWPSGMIDRDGCTL